MKTALIVLALVLVVVTACGSETEAEPASGDEPSAAYDEAAYGDDAADEDLAQDEWDAQEGDTWDEFNEGYLAGWEAGCDIAFEGSPDGSLYDQGDEYTVDDCYGLAPFDASDADVPLEVPADPYAEGEALGETHGCVAAFEQLSSYGVLNWGEDSFDESVCP